MLSRLVWSDIFLQRVRLELQVPQANVYEQVLCVVSFWGGWRRTSSTEKSWVVEWKLESWKSSLSPWVGPRRVRVFRRVLWKPTFGKRKPEAGAWLPKSGEGAGLLRLLNATWKLESFGNEFKESRCLPVDNGTLGGWEALKWRPFGKSPLLNGKWLGAGRTTPSPCHSLSPRLPGVRVPKWLGRRGSP